MTPEKFNEVLAYLAAGMHIDSDTLSLFILEVIKLRDDNARLQAELTELRRGLDALGNVRLGGLGHDASEYPKG